MSIHINGDSQTKVEEIHKLEEIIAGLRVNIEHQNSDLEAIVQERTKSLIDLIATKDRFLNIITHELRNPFNTILGFVSLLQENYRSYDNETVERFLNMIYRSTIITFDLLTNLLDWLNVKNNKMPYNPDNINVYELVTEEMHNSIVTAENKQIVLKNLVPENLYAYSDKNMVKTIFRNLLANAIKFSEKDSEVSIFAIDAGRFIEITVKDNGAGLSLEFIEKIFNIEGLQATKGTEGEPGTGFGLILCKQFVEIEGGEIWIESVLGQGSAFKFTLPKDTLEFM